MVMQEIIENTIHGAIAWQNDPVWANFSEDGELAGVVVVVPRRFLCVSSSLLLCGVGQGCLATVCDTLFVRVFDFSGCVWWCGSAVPAGRCVGYFCRFCRGFGGAGCRLCVTIACFSLLFAVVAIIRVSVATGAGGVFVQ